TALHYAARYGQLTVVKYLLSLKDANNNPLVDVNRSDNYGHAALHYAAMYNQLAVVECLVSLKDANNNPLVDVNRGDNYGWTALQLAASNGQLAVVKYLVSLVSGAPKARKNGEAYIRNNFSLN
ncbi:MAG: ankyrin repeat domain-containing protein, partial [Desulfosporosinus sp.]|nr:ankyrin repeat domain-containing protein [Desulfosporosinus sp.]